MNYVLSVVRHSKFIGALVVVIALWVALMGTANAAILCQGTTGGSVQTCNSYFNGVSQVCDDSGSVGASTGCRWMWSGVVCGSCISSGQRCLPDNTCAANPSDLCGGSTVLVTDGCSTCNNVCTPTCGSYGACSNSCGNGTQTAPNSCVAECGNTVTGANCSQACCEESGCTSANCNAVCTNPRCGQTEDGNYPCGGACSKGCGDNRSSTWTSPAAGANVTHDLTLSVAGTALDTNGAVAGVASVEVYTDGVLRVTLPVNATTGAFSTTLTANSTTFPASPYIGSHTIRLRAIPLEGAADCTAWDIGTRTINITNITTVNTNFVIDSGGAGQCTSTPGSPNTCDGDNIITTYDPNNNQRVTLSATFADADAVPAGRYSDIHNAYIVMNNTNTGNIIQDFGTPMPLRVTYTDNMDGTWSLAAASNKHITLVNTVTNSAANTVGSSSRNFSGGILTVTFTIELAGMADCTDDFLTNVYTWSVDFALASDVDRRIGIGAFTAPTDANAAGALDVWGGKTSCPTADLISTGDVTTPSFSMDVTTSAACATAFGVSSPMSIPVVDGSPIELPYYNLGGTANCALSINGGTSGFYLKGTNFTNVGGNNTTTVPPNPDTNSARSGGIRTQIQTVSVSYGNTAPTNATLQLNGTTCSGGGCDGSNIVTDFDSGYPPSTLQEIPIAIWFTDPDNPPSPPDTAYFANQRKIDLYVNQTANFNTNNDPTGAYFFGVHYLDNGNGTWSLSTSGTNAQNLPGTPNGLAVVDPVTNSAANTVGTSSRTRVGNVVTIRFTLDVAGMAGNQPFLGNMYVGAVDIGGGVSLANGSVPGAGAGLGNFSQGDLVGNVNGAVDFWNGRDIYVTGNMYQVTNANDLCVNGSRSSVGPNAVIPLGANIPITVAYTPNNLGSWPISINNWIGQNVYQPYYYYNYAGNGNQGYTITYQPTTTTSDYFLVSMDLIRYGGTCSTTVVGGQIQGMRFNRGGFRPDDSSHVDAAFGAKQISQVWSRSVDGDYFANSNVTTSIETSTCTDTDCYFSILQNAPQNGLPISNGTFGANINGRYGSPNNWYAQAGGAPSRMPYQSYTIQNYGAFKGLYGGVGYTEVTPPVGETYLLSSLAPQVNRIYFINGDFEVDQNFTVAANNYVVFIVAGDLTVNAGVTALQGIFIVPSGDFTIEDNAQPNYDVTNVSEQLTIQGSVVVGGSTAINRTMGAANNAESPVVFQARPDMVELLKANGDPIAVGALYYQGEF